MTISILQLWLPIVLGTLFAWIASALIHMLIKYHNADYQKLSNEDEVMEAVRNGSPNLGIHTIPHCSDMADMKNEAVQQRFSRGPVGMLTVFPNGMPNMGKAVGQQILYFLIGCILIAYCAILALTPGAEFMTVFRFVGAVGFLAFGWAIVPFSIWYGHPWAVSARYLLDALIYGLVVAASFAWLWPAASG